MPHRLVVASEAGIPAAAVSGVRIVREPVGSGAFAAVPRRLFESRIASLEKLSLDARRNPAMRGTETALWVARSPRGDLAGRIAAFAPAVRPDTGYFGFFESADDQPTADALLNAAAAWLAERGRATAFGPIAGIPRDQIGLLTDGFDRPATMFTPFNPPYYRQLLERNGWRPAVGLRSYGWSTAFTELERVGPMMARIRRQGTITIRPLDPTQLARETATVTRLMNASFGRTWHWSPIGDAEAAAEAKDLAFLLDPRISLMAENHEGPLGVLLAVPDANWLWRRIGGRLLPFGWLAALRWRRRIPWARVMVLAVRPDRQQGATAVALMTEFHRAILAAGYEYAEFAQIFDDNLPMRRILDRAGFPVVKRFTVFERSLSSKEPHDAH